MQQAEGLVLNLSSDQQRLRPLFDARVKATRQGKSELKSQTVKVGAPLRDAHAKSPFKNSLHKSAQTHTNQAEGAKPRSQVSTNPAVKTGMPRETYSPAKDPEIHELIARGSALIGSLDVMRKARGMPSFTDDMNAYWTWCQSGEPDDPRMIDIIRRLIRDGASA